MRPMKLGRPRDHDVEKSEETDEGGFEKYKKHPCDPPDDRDPDQQGAEESDPEGRPDEEAVSLPSRPVSSNRRSGANRHPREEGEIELGECEAEEEAGEGSQQGPPPKAHRRLIRRSRGTGPVSGPPSGPDSSRGDTGRRRTPASPSPA